MKTVHYVYCYLNPLKKGVYQYEEFSFSCEPFYVGKGTRNRYSIHDRLFKLGKLNRSKNTLKYDTLAKIYNAKTSPIILILRDNISDEEASNLEILAISTIGKRCENKGPLANITDGGNGGDVWKNHPNIENYKKNMSSAISGEKNGMYGRPLINHPSHIAAESGRHWNSKPWTPERKEMMRNLKPKNWSATAQKITVEIENEYLNFLSIKAACEALSISYGGLLNEWKRKSPGSNTYTYKKIKFTKNDKN